MEFDYDDFLDGIGLGKGDVIDVASDLFSILLYCSEREMDFEPNRLIDAMINKVGKEGTIMIRAFTWRFCEGKPFDIRKSKSQVGHLGNVALKRIDFKRTKHPIYNWMVYGKYADELASLENINGVGEDSPFAFLCKHHGKFLILGNIDENGDANTIFHYYENEIGVPYRKEKFFESEYIDFEGNKSTRKYSVLVRPKNHDVCTPVDMLKAWHYHLVEEGLEIESYYDGAILRRVGDCEELRKESQEEILVNDSLSVLLFDGRSGIKASGIDWSDAIYD